MRPKQPSAERDALIYRDQVDLLYSHLPIGMTATILNSIILVVASWRWVPHAFLIAWLLAIAIIAAARAILVWRYRKSGHQVSDARKWGMLFVFGLACSGCAWGATTTMLFYAPSIEYQLLIAFVVGGMIAGASATLSALRLAYYSFAIPAFLPVTIAIFVFADSMHAMVGLMMMLFLILLSVTAANMSRVARQSFRLRYEKNELIAGMEQCRRQTEGANAVLQKQIAIREKAEADLRALSAGLEEKVRQRTEDLERINNELNAFSYSVSHDLRAPLQVIYASSDALEQDCGATLQEPGQQYLSAIHDSIRKMNDLINDLLTLSRVSQQELNLQSCNLTDMAHEITAALKKHEPSRIVEFVIHEGITARCDKKLFRIALENLFGNAWKYTGKTSQARIEFGTREENGRIVFFVSDNGAGFSMAYAGRLFKPFQRLHPQREFEGTGVGLATVHRIIQRHGGSIWAEAAVGKGATFCFVLPAAT